MARLAALDPITLPDVLQGIGLGSPVGQVGAVSCVSERTWQLKRKGQGLTATAR